MQSLCQEDLDRIIREVDAEVGDVCRAQAAEGREDVPAPDGPGLYAVVAPDGVTIRVVDGQTTRECLFLIMQKDMTERLLTEESARMLRDPRESLTSVLLKQTAKRVVLSPLIKNGKNRTRRLRGYGNSLCAPVAEAFMRVVMEHLDSEKTT